MGAVWGLEAGQWTLRGLLSSIEFTVSSPPATVQSVVLNDGSAQRSRVTSLTVTFNDTVTLDPGAFELRREGGAMVGLLVNASVVDGRTVAVLSFAGPHVYAGSLADGNYTLTIRGELIHDALGRALDGDGDGQPGGDRVEAFFRLFGDSDGDGDIDAADLVRFDSALRTSAANPGYLSYFDSDGDGDIDAADRAEFLLRLVYECTDDICPPSVCAGWCGGGPTEDP